MIHLIEVSPEITPDKLKKLSRRYAMTGGFEISIKEGISSEELYEIVDIYLPELSDIPTSNANRILSLIYTHPLVDNGVRERLSGEIHSLTISEG